MFYGTVKLCNFDRGFGFIDRGGGKDVYFHATVVEGNAFDRIRPGHVWQPRAERAVAD